jgi:hypothetical protein
MEMAMTIANGLGKAAVVVVLGMPMVAAAQYSGVSHPDETPIRNSVETTTVLAPAKAAEPAAEQTQGAQPRLKPRPEIPMETAVATVPETSMRVAEPMPPAPVEDIDAGIVTRVPGPANQLPVGTIVNVSLVEDVSTETTANGTAFTARLLEGVERDGRILLPAGSMLAGMVTDLHHGKRLSGPAAIHLRTASVTLPDGTKYALHGQVIDTSLHRQVKIDREGTMYGKDHPGRVAATFAMTTGSGLAAGALIAGVPGALVGAGVGAGVSTVVWLRQERNANLPVGTKVSFALTDPLTVGLQ